MTLGGVSMAEADIVDSATTLTLENLGESFNVDVDFDGTDDFNVSMADNFGGASNPASIWAVISGLGGNRVGNAVGATYNAVNSYLGAFSQFSAASTTAGVAAIKYASFFGSGGAEFIGLEFGISGNTHFGAANLLDNADGTATMSFRWEDVSGVAFDTTAVPEPTSLALLALGTLGLAARRRRK